MREKWFSITRDDFRWDYFRAPGNGGQKRNVTDSACRCTHEESGAVGQASDSRKQGENRELAFERCVKTKRFQVWLKMEIARRSGAKSLEEQVDDMMKPNNLKVEYKLDGKWVDIRVMDQERQTISEDE